MDGVDRVPVRGAQHAARVEGRSLTDRGSASGEAALPRTRATRDPAASGRRTVATADPVRTRRLSRRRSRLRPRSNPGRDAPGACRRRRGARSSQPRAVQRILPKYHPVAPPMRRTGSNAVSGDTSTATVRVSTFNRCFSPFLDRFHERRREASWVRSRTRCSRPRRPDDRRVLQPVDERATDTRLGGVTSASHRPDRCGVSTGTGSSSRRSPRSRAYSRIMSP